MTSIEERHARGKPLEPALGKLLADFAPPPVVVTAGPRAVTLILRAEEETTGDAERREGARSWRRWRVEVPCAAGSYAPVQPALLRSAGGVVRVDSGHPRHLAPRPRDAVPLDAIALARWLLWMRRARPRERPTSTETHEWGRFVRQRFWDHQRAEHVTLWRRVAAEPRRWLRRPLRAAHPWLGRGRTWQPERTTIDVSIGPEKVAIAAVFDEALRAAWPFAYWLADDIALHATWVYASEVQVEVLDAAGHYGRSGEFTFV